MEVVKANRKGLNLVTILYPAIAPGVGSGFCDMSLLESRHVSVLVLFLVSVSVSLLILVLVSILVSVLIVVSQAVITVGIMMTPYV